VAIKGCVNSALVDPAVAERLATAAEAGGFRSVEALINCVVDSGAVGLPPSDGISQVYTLENLGEQMHAQMPAPGKRAPWFRTLVETQKTALIVLLRTRGYSTAVIARDFAIHELEVNKVYSRHADELGSQVINVRLNTLVGHLQIAAERASEGAMRKEDWGSYWRIQKEMIALLQSLGIVNQAIRRVEVAHHFDDQKQAELDDLLQLERQKRNRLEEIKMADATVLDELPPLLESKHPNLSMEEGFDE